MEKTGTSQALFGFGNKGKVDLRSLVVLFLPASHPSRVLHVQITYTLGAAGAGLVQLAYSKTHLSDIQPQSLDSVASQLLHVDWWACTYSVYVYLEVVADIGSLKLLLLLSCYNRWL